MPEYLLRLSIHIDIQNRNKEEIEEIFNNNLNIMMSEIESQEQKRLQYLSYNIARIEEI